MGKKKTKDFLDLPDPDADEPAAADPEPRPAKAGGKAKKGKAKKGGKGKGGFDSDDDKDAELAPAAADSDEEPLVKPGKAGKGSKKAAASAFALLDAADGDDDDDEEEDDEPAPASKVSCMRGREARPCCQGLASPDQLGSHRTVAARGSSRAKLPGAAAAACLLLCSELHAKAPPREASARAQQALPAAPGGRALARACTRSPRP